METKEIQDFYNHDLSTHDTEYETRRWFSSAQARAGYDNTAAALKRYVWPLLHNDAVVLELGPGPGTWTKLLLEKAPSATFDLVDISAEMLNQARNAIGERPNVTLIESDILDFTPERSYDVFFSSRILEYVPDYTAAVATICAALKPGGTGYLVTKTPQYHRPWRRSQAGAIHGHQIAPTDLVTALEAHGCTLQQRVHVTCVCPGLRSGLLDRWLTALCRVLPFAMGTYVSESYAVVFTKS